MITKIFTVLIVLVSVSGILRAQMYDRGFMISNAGDTIRGMIESRENILNPTWVNFKSTSDDKKPRRYGLTEIRQFTFDNGESFERHWISMTMDPILLGEANDKKVEVRFDTVFLRVIQRGNAMVFYSFEDKVKKRYYILQPGNSRPLELGYRVERSGPNYTYRYPFRETLQMIAESHGKDSPSIRKLIAKADYYETSLLQIISEINGMNPVRSYVEMSEGKGFRFGSGIRIGGMRFQGENELSKNASSTVSPGYWFMVAYDLPQNPRVGKIVIRTEAFFSANDAESHSFDNRFISAKMVVEHYFTQRNSGLGIGAMVNFVNKPQLKVFGGLGCRVNYSSYSYKLTITRTGDSSTSVMVDDNSGEPRNLWSSFPIRIGAVINRKFEATVLYTPARNMHSSSPYYTFKMDFLEAGLVYHLSRR